MQECGDFLIFFFWGGGQAHSWANRCICASNLPAGTALHARFRYWPACALCTLHAHACHTSSQKVAHS